MSLERLTNNENKESRTTINYRMLVGLMILFGTICYFLKTPISWVKRNYLQTQEIRSLVESEKQILELQQHLNKVSNSALNLRIPDWETRHHFSTEFRKKGLTEKSLKDLLSDSSPDTAHPWSIETKLNQANPENLSLFTPLVTKLEFLERFTFKVIDGHFLDRKGHQFQIQVKVDGVGKLKSAPTFIAITGKLSITCSRPDVTQPWKFSEWKIKQFSTRTRSNRMFQDVIESAILSEADREKAVKSIHAELISQYNQFKGTPLPDPDFKYKFDYASGNYHPGLAITDINQDGWDDVYVMARWGKNQLYINNGNGQFEEQAEKYGLDIAHHCTSANFADFDNDGDPDLILGRSAARSLYLENEAGYFSDQSASAYDGLLPAMVSSISSTDYNNDGLLDIYISTYGNTMPLLIEFLTDEQRWEYNQRLTQVRNKFTDGSGTPNILLVNQGNGKFTTNKASSQLELWQPTLQSTWSDFDQDGDQDVYVANDFGPDRLMRNDLSEGFTDITESSGHPTMMGFGMGATWGDYDLDGKRDLYVSNMYSKAGMRITKKVGNLDQRFTSFANGNRLYRQKENSFEHTSAPDNTNELTSHAGWSWGGQFGDFNNDGFPDIYVVSGYFTAPKKFDRLDDQ